MRGGLYSGFESFRIPKVEELEQALQMGIVAVDTNVLLNLYRYNKLTVGDLFKIFGKVGNRLFVPHQVVKEFWRNRQTVLASTGAATREAQGQLQRNAASTADAVKRWAKNVALADENLTDLLSEVDQLFDNLKRRVDEQLPERIAANSPTDDDYLLVEIEKMLIGAVGEPLVLQL